MKRLSKISRELNVKISDIVEFLQLNGYDCSDNPNEEISYDAYETIKYNLNGFLAERKKQIASKPTLKKQKGDTSVTIEQIPLELKIVEAASKEKKLIERIVGFSDYSWNFIVAKYHGVCSQPVQFGLFDEVLCGLLLEEEMAANKMGELLGFDINRDPAEEEILMNAIAELKKDNMIDSDESQYWLTPTGKDYARNGVKFSTFERDFELYFDLTGGVVENAKDIFSKIKSEKLSTSKPDVNWDIEAIKNLAEHQAPEIHFPDKDYFLQSATFIEADVFRANVWVVLFENFRDNTLRAVVYDENQNKIINDLSEALNLNEEVKVNLLNKLVSVEESPVEVTEEEKSKEQIESEKQLIIKQEEIETAIDNNELEKVIQLTKEIEAVKRHFSTLEFEVELKRLFDTTSDELWIISPWIKRAAIRRIPFFESYIRKGGKIFIGYSEPENPTDMMVLPEAMEKLDDLERKYPNSFYLHSLPFFHWKNVWLKKQDQKNIFYTGSYNILSFFVQQGQQKVRQEEMIKIDWNDDTQTKFENVLAKFGLKYLNKAKTEFDSLCQSPPTQIDRTYLQKIKTYDNLKLKPFLNQGVKDFDKAFRELEKSKDLQLTLFRKKFFEQQIDLFKKQVASHVEKAISPDAKRRLKNDFEKLRDEFIEFMDLQLIASPVTDMIEGLREFRFQNKPKSNRNNR